MYKRIKDGTQGDKIAWHTIPAIISVLVKGDSLNSVNQIIRNRYL